MMYKLFKFIRVGMEKFAKVFRLLSSVFSPRSVKNNITTSSKYKFPRDDKKSIQEDYKRSGKDLYKALTKEQEKATN